MIQTTLKIDGMMCGMCEAHINDAIRSNFNVKKVASSHSKGQSIITSEKPLDEQKLSDVIQKTGYELKAIQSSEIEKSGGLFGIFKKK